MRRALALAAVVASVTGLVGPAEPAAAGHPLFNDHGTLEWYRTLDEACAAARAQGKLVFVDSSRLACGNCRALVGRILPCDIVRDRIRAAAVGYADDCDSPDPRTWAMFGRFLPNAVMLPLVGFVTPDLQWVTGWSGFADPQTVAGHLSRAESVLATRRAEGRARDDIARRAEEERRRKSEEEQRARKAIEEREAAASRAKVVVPPAPAPVASKPAPTPPPAACSEADAEDEEDPCKDGSCALPGMFGKPLASPAPAAPPAPPVAAPKPPVVEPRPFAAMPPAAVVTPLPPPARRTPTVVERARTAAALGRWGELARLGDEGRTLPKGSDREEVDLLAQRAHGWALDTMAAAVVAAEEHRYADAIGLLERVRREMADRPVAVDAERGVSAVERLAAIDGSYSARARDAETMRRAAYADFRGSRWASLFRARPG